MEQVSRGWQLLAVALLLLILQLHQQQIYTAAAAVAVKNETEPNVAAKGISVKKERPLSPPSHPEAEAALPTQQAKAATQSTEKAVEIIEAQQQPKKNPPTLGEEKVHSTAENGVMPVDSNVHIERSNGKGEDIDFADSFTPIYYVLVAISSSAILLLVARVYRLRLSRAERKYGVQGDRANQELTPLPMAIEDVNSDEDEDHTLFEVNRQSIRIL